MKSTSRFFFLKYTTVNNLNIRGYCISLIFFPFPATPSHSQTLRDSCKRNSHDNKTDALPVTETLKVREIWGRPGGAISSINTSIHHRWASVVRAGTAREIMKPMEEETEDKNYPSFVLHHSPNDATYCCFSSKVFSAELKTWMLEICYFLQSCVSVINNCHLYKG